MSISIFHIKITFIIGFILCSGSAYAERSVLTFTTEKVSLNSGNFPEAYMIWWDDLFEVKGATKVAFSSVVSPTIGVTFRPENTPLSYLLVVKDADSWIPKPINDGKSLTISQLSNAQDQLQQKKEELKKLQDSLSKIKDEQSIYRSQLQQKLPVEKILEARLSSDQINSEITDLTKESATLKQSLDTIARYKINSDSFLTQESLLRQLNEELKIALGASLNARTRKSSK